jgi:hypothetical protein
MKSCSKCKENKLVEEFHKNRRAPDGLEYYCKSCVSVRMKVQYNASLESRRKASRTSYHKNKEKLEVEIFS